MSSSTPLPDYGIDLSLHDIQFVGGRRVESGCKLDVQAKCTTRASLQGQYVRHDLEVTSYNALRLITAGCPPHPRRAGPAREGGRLVQPNGK
jgi:hypothetical protein